MLQYERLELIERGQKWSLVPKRPVADSLVCKQRNIAKRDGIILMRSGRCGEGIGCVVGYFRAILCDNEDRSIVSRKRRAKNIDTSRWRRVIYLVVCVEIIRYLHCRNNRGIPSRNDVTVFVCYASCRTLDNR